MTVKAAKITIQPTKFSGRINEDPFKYLQSFNLAATSNNWTDEIKIKIIPNYLVDTAHLWNLNYIREWNLEATTAATWVPNTAKSFWE